MTLKTAVLFPVAFLIGVFLAWSGGCSSESEATDAGADVGISDAGDPPRPTAACGTDLDVHNGSVSPDFGTIPEGGTFTGDPSSDGPLKMIAVDATLPNPDSTRQPVLVTTYTPSADGVVAEKGPFPLVVLLPGFTSGHVSYIRFTRHFVSYGIAVLGVTPAQLSMQYDSNNPASVAEIRAALDWGLSQSPLKGLIDESKIAISGHSAGGKLAFYTAAEDHRIKIVIGWDPQNGGGPPCFIDAARCDRWPVAPNCDPDRGVEDPGMLDKIDAESMVMAARDEAITPDKHLWAENFYRGAPTPAHLVIFKAAMHTDWNIEGSTADYTKRANIALILTRFKGVKGLEDYIPIGKYWARKKDIEAHNK